MLKNNIISLWERILCLITFGIVVLLSDNIVSLLILFLFLLINIIKSRDINYIVLCFIIFIIGLFCYFINNYWLWKFSIIYAYGIYFMKINILRKKRKVIDKNYSEYDYLRFRRDKNYISSYERIIYVTMHLGILFLSIVVGSCVI